MLLPDSISNQQDLVTIIIPFYNCSYVGKSISSALQQTYKNIEIILVDDGSTLHDQLLKPFLNRIVYMKKSNGGTASALNKGFKRAKGEYIVWLSSDDIIIPEKIEKQLSFMKRENAKFSFTDYKLINDKNEILTGSGVLSNYSKESLLDGLKTSCTINGSTIMMKRELLASAGIFDLSYRYAHDYEYWIRVCLKHNPAFLQEPLTLYRIHNKMGTKKHLREISEETDRIKKKYGPALNNFQGWKGAK
ncbi:glycosyltransferase [Bacillus sp. MMSF_3328]|uniref:glycosyltransferase n=1 Tax=Bacillus sp. MMSF_3328 TaxID=3047080 RepID=UPI00273F87F1|nr:glycosyltransferase [Bacillus sp. MMSF_3328]